MRSRLPALVLSLFPALATAGPDPVPPARLERVRFEVRAAEKEPAKGLTEVVVPGEGEKIYIHKQPVITGKDVTVARVVEAPAGSFVLEITLTREGAGKMEKFSGTWLNKPMAILVDGKVIWAGTVLTRLSKDVGLNGKKEVLEMAAKAIRDR